MPSSIPSIIAHAGIVGTRRCCQARSVHGFLDFLQSHPMIPQLARYAPFLDSKPRSSISFGGANNVCKIHQFDSPAIPAKL